MNVLEAVRRRLGSRDAGESRTTERSDSREGVPDGSLEALRRQFDPALGAVGTRCDEPALDDLDHPHLSRPTSVDEATVREQALAYRERGADPSAFVAAHGVTVDALVEATFDQLRADLGEEAALEEAEMALSTALESVVSSMSVGVEAATREPVAADGGEHEADLRVEAESDLAGPSDGSSVDGNDPEMEGVAKEFPLGYAPIMDHVGTALFVLDDEGDIVFWNRGAEKLTGEPRESAYEYDMASRAFYHDGRRAKTLADKVLDAPESADEEYGVPRVEGVDYTLYRDTSTMTAAGGETVHISFSAAPLYRDGELVGVVEMVQDRTEDAVRQNRMDEFVGELKTTLDAMQAGDADARASFEYQGYIEEELLDVVDNVNEMAEQFAVLSELTAQITGLHDQAQSVVDTSQEITDAAADQTETMEQLSREISNLSATVEEVASSAAQVDTTSSDAEELAIEGQESAEEAVSLMTDVADSADAVTDDVTKLQDRIDEIDEIVTVINDIADQTNILALNASIEAARAGEAGEGFAVVADEVKQLAEESQQNATEIEQLIDNIQEDTDDTVSNLAETTRRIDNVIDQVQDAMEKLGDIVDAISEASEGIQEVANATDDQAASTEEIAGMIDDAADQADEIADEIDEVAATNEAQMREIEDLRRTVEEHTY